jgi:hypothetical protein
LNNLTAVRPDWWRESLHRSMRSVSKNLFINNQATLKLLSIWSRYQHLLLVHIPTSDQLPLSKAQFDDLEEKHMKKTRKMFDTEYVLAFFDRSLPSDTDLVYTIIVGGWKLKRYLNYL